MLPDIDQIQGGMGVNISNPALANAIARLGKPGTILATVSGVAVDKIMLLLLQSGDPGGDIRRALSHFPSREVVTEILDRYYVPGGLPPGAPYKLAPMLRIDQPSPWAITLLVCANFAFVWLAKEGHSNPISINWLEKMQRFHLYSIAGAMLAGVDVVTMGAGIPHQIPHVLDAYAHGQPAEYRVTVTDCKDRTMAMRFDPREFFGQWWPEELRRPGFIPVVSSHVLAEKLMEVAPGGIDAVVAEGPKAGGHNAWPRGKPVFNEGGEPIYGVRDEPNFGRYRSLGVPYYLGGGYASPAGLALARSVGARGIQTGSIWALSNSSGLYSGHRRDVIRRYHRGELRIKQDPKASSAGYPLQVAQLPGTLSDEAVYQARIRECRHHGLSVPHQMPDGSIVYRCPAEPVEEYLAKGGNKADTEGVRCPCEGLIATAGYGELSIVTLGSDLSFLAHLTKDEDDSYTLEQAVAYLMGPV